MRKLVIIFIMANTIVSCSKDKDPIIIVPPSGGSTLTLQGNTGTLTGSLAGNSVFVDLSTDKQTSILRSSWDLGFYTGSEFRVILNNTSAAFAKVTSKTDIDAVNSSDTVGAMLIFNQANPPLVTSGIADDISGDITKTVIPEISATEASNHVIVINRGTGGGIEARDLVKIRILRNNDGYTLQYAPLTATTFSTVQVSKEGDGNFNYISLTNGSSVNTGITKDGWDIQWGNSLYTTGPYYYPFSDLVAINTLDGVQAFHTAYADAPTANQAYQDFNKDSVSKYTFSGNRWAIGSGWRKTAAPGVTDPGVTKNMFYVVKDPNGNLYKLKFLSFTTEDGGTRGQPQIQYQLIN